VTQISRAMLFVKNLELIFWYSIWSLAQKALTLQTVLKIVMIFELVALGD
jgi:hypothetical protein